MDVKLYRWWTNVSELLRAEDWESVRHRVEARIPPIFRVLATRFLPFKLALLFMVGLAASHRLPSLSKGGKRPIVGYGPSSNNRRVLVRVLRMAPDLDAILLANSRAFIPPLSHWRDIAFLGWVLLARFRLFRQPSSLLQGMMLCQYLVSYIHFRREFRRAPPRLVLVANDHSPLQCGFTAAAKAAGIAVVYVQHAQVGPRLPRLKFDLSLLFGANSQQIYASKGPVPPCLLIGSGLRSDGPASRAVELPNAVRSIGLALTNVQPSGNLPDLVRKIKAAFEADELFIRPHPAFRGDFPQEITRVAQVRLGNEMAKDAADADLFICGNSSAVLEILHYGVPVAYCSEIDAFTNDYYGFVSMGVVPRLTLDQPGAAYAVRDHFKGDWRERAGQFDASFLLAEEQIARNVSKALTALA